MSFAKRVMKQIHYRTLTTSIKHSPKLMINDEYECRFLTHADQQSVCELCTTVWGSNDFVSACFHRYINDINCIFLGVEYKPKSQIVATRITKIIDGGVSGLGIGARMHPKHRGKNIFSQFRHWNNELIQFNYPNVKRILGTTYGSNSRSLHVQQKDGQIPIENIPTLKWIQITNPINKGIVYNQSYIISTNQMNKLLIETNVFEKNYDYNDCFYIITDIDYVIYLLKNKWNKKRLFMDLKVFDLSIGEASVADAKRYLKEEMDCNRLTVWIDKYSKSIGMVYVDERPKLIQVYINGTGENGFQAMLMTNMLVNKCKEIRNCWLFVDEEIVNGDFKMKQLCQGFESIVVTELIFDQNKW
eukprot:318849_1